ncbi:MAG TPA: phosphoenolpyruvate synthase regulatory protein, partial [Hyphomonas sp.]|nr:phosphoenolpyruvate synthase regulatory protein [Hyphomonas sp.]
MCFANLGNTGAMNKPLARLSIYFNVHLVSDSTGETLNAIQRAACAQFKNVQPL